MAAQYLLPCECGSTTPIDTSQAGSAVVCGCGKTLDVPSLRAIRELKPHADNADTPKYEWNPAAGMIFAGGVVIALVGAGVAFFSHWNSVQAANYQPLPNDQKIAAWIAEVDTAPPEDLIEMWNVSRHLGLGEYKMSPFVQARIMSQRFAMYRNTGLIVMASGLAFASTSILLRRKSHA